MLWRELLPHAIALIFLSRLHVSSALEGFALGAIHANGATNDYPARLELAAHSSGSVMLESDVHIARCVNRSMLDQTELRELQIEQ